MTVAPTAKATDLVVQAVLQPFAEAPLPDAADSHIAAAAACARMQPTPPAAPAGPRHRGRALRLRRLVPLPVASLLATIPMKAAVAAVAVGVAVAGGLAANEALRSTPTAPPAEDTLDENSSSTQFDAGEGDVPPAASDETGMLSDAADSRSGDRSKKGSGVSPADDRAGDVPADDAVGHGEEGADADDQDGDSDDESGEDQEGDGGDDADDESSDDDVKDRDDDEDGRDHPGDGDGGDQEDYGDPEGSDSEELDDPDGELELPDDPALSDADTADAADQDGDGADETPSQMDESGSDTIDSDAVSD